MAKLLNLARMTTSTTGTGSTIALGAAVAGYLTFALAGAVNGGVYAYAIKDGSNSEAGTITYSTTGPQLTGRTPVSSTNSNAAISLSGTAEVFITPLAADIANLREVNTFTDKLQFPDANGIYDDSGIGQLIFQKTASAVNYFEMQNAATAGTVVLRAVGTDSNVPISIQPKGEGSVSLYVGNNDTADIHEIFSILAYPTSGTTAAGFGSSIGLWLENAAGSQVKMGYINLTYTQPTGGAERGHISLGVQSDTGVFQEITIGENGGDVCTISDPAGPLDFMSIYTEFGLGVRSITVPANLELDWLAQAPTDGSDFAALRFQAWSNANTLRCFASINAQASSIADGAEAGVLSISTINAGTLTKAVQINSLQKITDNDGQLIKGIALIRQHATYSLTSQTAAQKLFNGSTNGSLTLPLGAYEFEALVALASMSGTSGNAMFSMVAGTAVIANGFTLWTAIDAAATAAGGSAWLSGYALTPTPALSPTNFATAATNTAMFFRVQGTFEVTTAGTVIPSISLTTAAAAVVQIGSFFKCWRMGATTDVVQGTWT